MQLPQQHPEGLAMAFWSCPEVWLAPVTPALPLWCLLKAIKELRLFQRPEVTTATEAAFV